MISIYLDEVMNLNPAFSQLFIKMLRCDVFLDELWMINEWYTILQLHSMYESLKEYVFSFQVHIWTMTYKILFMIRKGSIEIVFHRY